MPVIASSMPRLQDLKLGYCRPGITISGLKALSTLTQLTTLHCPTLTDAEAAGSGTAAPVTAGPAGTSLNLVSSWSAQSSASAAWLASGRQLQALEGLSEQQQSAEAQQTAQWQPVHLWQPHPPSLQAPDEVSTFHEPSPETEVDTLQVLPASLQELNLRG